MAAGDDSAALRVTAAALAAIAVLLGVLLWQSADAALRARAEETRAEAERVDALAAARAVESARDLESGARTHWDIVPQVQVTLNTRQHVMLNVGWRTPLNDRRGRQSQLLFYVLWDWFDGGLRDGW